MAKGVRTFSRAHPTDDTGYTLVLTRLDGTIVRLEQLATAQTGGIRSKHASVVWRQDVRRRVHFGLLRHLVTAAEDAGTEAPDVAEKFRLPHVGATHAAFRAAASRMLEEARAHQDLLVRHGLSSTLLDQLEAGLQEFDASRQETDEGKQAHVAARAEMKEISDEIRRLVGILDGFNRYRWHTEPELIAAWNSARRVVTTPRPTEDEETSTPTTPVPSGLEPAA